MSTTVTTGLTTEHPVWCDPDRCMFRDGRLAGVLEMEERSHDSAPASLEVGGPYGVTTHVALSNFPFMDYQDRGGETYVSVWLDDGPGPVTPDELEALGRWLVDQAETMRRLIAQEA